MILSFINPSVSPHLQLYDTTPVKDFKSGAFSDTTPSHKTVRANDC